MLALALGKVENVTYSFRAYTAVKAGDLYLLSTAIVCFSGVVAGLSKSIGLTGFAAMLV